MTAMEMMHEFWPIAVTVIGLAAGFGANRMAVMQLATKIDALTVSVAALQTLLNNLATRVAVHEVTVQHHIDDDTKQFTKLVARVDELDRHVNEIRMTCVARYTEERQCSWSPSSHSGVKP